jgi:signal transduction histidine kinase
MSDLELLGRLEAYLQGATGSPVVLVTRAPTRKSPRCSSPASSMPPGSAAFRSSSIATRCNSSPCRFGAAGRAATNGLLTLLLAAGWLLVSAMMRPVRVLARHLGQGGENAPTPIPDAVVARTRGEFGNLFRRHNALVRSMAEGEDLARRLAEEERLASLGRLASAVAHEINNPLGGMLNALATLKAHGQLAHVRAGSIGLIDRGPEPARRSPRASCTRCRTRRTVRSWR